MTITTREELINALVAAAELEHGLMIQYLYAGMTLKTSTSEQLTPAQLAVVRVWNQRIRGVAKQEMGHLATVLNLLESIGGGSYLNRMRFPSEVGLYTPPIPFGLEPLTLQTIDRFITFEMPELPVAAKGLAPEPVVFQHVGQLYNDIKAGIAAFPERELFIGRLSGQDRSRWSLSITVSPVTDRASAIAAIDTIVLEGEGNSTGSDQSHYGRFKTIALEYQRERERDAAFQPHRDVLSNPATLPSQHGQSDTNVITAPDTKAVAELFNACYTTLLIVLVKYYRFEEAADFQDTLQGIAKVLMMNVLGRLGPLLSQLPSGLGKNAGPPFEIYTLPSLPGDRDASLTVLRERCAISETFARALAARVPQDGALLHVAETLNQVLQTIPE